MSRRSFLQQTSTSRVQCWRRLAASLLLAALPAWLGPTPALAHESKQESRLPKIGPAPAFTLTDQDGRRFSLSDTRGKVAVVTFIFTTCSDTCPLLTAKLVAIQRKLGVDESRVHFVGITVDPLTDTPVVLKKYAQTFSADPAHFVFLTGSMQEIEDVGRRYAVYHKKQPNGTVDHTFLTSIIDPAGTLRVQYLGVRFDPKEFLGDVRSVLAEAQRQ